MTILCFFLRTAPKSATGLASAQQCPNTIAAEAAGTLLVFLVLPVKRFLPFDENLRKLPTPGRDCKMGLSERRERERGGAATPIQRERSLGVSRGWCSKGPQVHSCGQPDSAPLEALPRLRFDRA